MPQGPGRCCRALTRSGKARRSRQASRSTDSSAALRAAGQRAGRSAAGLGAGWCPSAGIDELRRLLGPHGGHRRDLIARAGRRELAEQAEVSYVWMVRDWQAARPAPAKVEASVTLERA